MTNPLITKSKRKDNTGEFKKNFLKLLQRDREANRKWDLYKGTRTCGSSKPCVRIHLNFCVEQGGEAFFNLKKEYKIVSGNKIGSRHCRCPIAYETLPVYFLL